MLPVCIAPLRENTCPKMSSQSAGWRARVMSSVKSWRSLRNSNSVMTNVFSMKPAKGWMKAAVIGFGLAKALGRGAFGGCVAEGATGIKGAAGIVYEDLIQRVARAERGLEFFARAKRSHLAQVHDRDAITMALRLLQVMGGEEQGRAIVGPQINEGFPKRVARNRVQPDGRLIEEEHPWSMQRGLGDFQPTNHAAGVLAHQAAAVGSQTHDTRMLPLPRMWPSASRKVQNHLPPKRVRSVNALCGAVSQIFFTETSCGLSAGAAESRGQKNTDRYSATKPQPNCAKRLECAELAPAFEPSEALRKRQQAGRTPNASRGSSSARPFAACEQVRPLQYGDGRNWPLLILWLVSGRSVAYQSTCRAAYGRSGRTCPAGAPHCRPRGACRGVPLLGSAGRACGLGIRSGNHNSPLH